jgi:general secretion pathway protein I
MRAKTHGFTLIEILIALTILAIALAAAMRGLALSTDAASETKTRTLATWVAQNRVALAQALVLTQGSLPPIANAQNTVEMAGLQFKVDETVTESPNKAFRKFVVKVSLKQSVNQPNIDDPNARSLVSLEAYLTQSGQ